MKHSSSAGAVLIGPSKQVVVVSQHGTSWSLIKGTLEPGENKVQALRREINEESSITDFDIITELGSYKRYIIGLDGGEDKSEIKTISIYLCLTNQFELNPLDPAIPEARWVSPDVVVNLLTHPKDKQFFRIHLKQVEDFIAQI